jgi:fumarylacetoacetate (FAA) hydrolase family protein
LGTSSAKWVGQLQRLAATRQPKASRLLAVDKFIEANLVAVGLVLSPLEESVEKSMGSRDGKRDKAKLSEDAAPLFGADMALAVEGVEDAMELLLAMGWKFQGLASCGVDDPLED